MRKVIGYGVLAVFAVFVTAFGGFLYVATHPAPAVAELRPMNVSVAYKNHKKNQQKVYVCSSTPDGRFVTGPLTRARAEAEIASPFYEGTQARIVTREESDDCLFGKSSAVAAAK